MNRALILIVSLLALGGCRGDLFTEPPIHLNPNMDTQDYYKAYGSSELFADGRTMRQPPAGAVARGFGKTDDAYDRGTDEVGEFITSFPAQVIVSRPLLQRGQERFNIYCTPCHDRTGSGNGIVVQRGLNKPPTLVDPKDVNGKRIIKMPVGEIFHTITNGKNTMPAYRGQIPTADRWAIIAYLRALQRSQNADISDVPAADRGKVQ